LLGQLFTLVPMFWLGYAGMPRRVLDYPTSLGGWHSLISGGHMLSVAGMLAFFIMLFDSIRQNRAVARNTFGVGRYNTRLNFYIYEIARLQFVQKKSWTFSRLFRYKSPKPNSPNYVNYENLETVLYSYVFVKNTKYIYKKNV
jgi:heme/copper-type cytochrome/quinol oxidase subunit 1